jgi:hypothetical protein
MFAERFRCLINFSNEHVFEQQQASVCMAKNINSPFMIRPNGWIIIFIRTPKPQLNLQPKAFVYYIFECETKRKFLAN